MSAYIGNGPILGMSLEQQRAACRLAEPQMHDGLLRAINKALPGPPPYSKANVAIKTALAGIDGPWVS